MSLYCIGTRSYASRTYISYNLSKQAIKQSKVHYSGTVGCASGGHGFEPLLFPVARRFTLIAKYWFVSGTDWSVISQST